MAYIYSIQNKLTGKYYIGQTMRDPFSPRGRWEEHIRLAKKIIKDPDVLNDPRYKRKITQLYKDMAELGIENFEFNIIEECEDSERFNREIFYVEKFNSFRDGYNGTTGGKPITSIVDTKLREDILRLYTKEDIKSEREIGRILDISPHTVDRELRKAGIDLPTHHDAVVQYNHKKRRRVVQLNDDFEIINTFECLIEAAEFICKYQNLDKNPRSVAGGIEFSCLHPKYKSRGYYWRREEEYNNERTKND